MERLLRFLKDDEGATAPEYALMVALIAAVIIVGAGLLGTAVDEKLSFVAGVIDTAGTAGGS